MGSKRAWHGENEPGSKRARLAEINRNVKRFQAKEGENTRRQAEKLKQEAAEKAGRAKAYAKAEAQVDAAFKNFRKARFGEGLELLRAAHSTLSEAGNREAAKRIWPLLDSAEEVSRALKTIKEIREKYPPTQLSAISVHVPEKADNEQLFLSHRAVAEHLPNLFGRPVEECPPAAAHLKEAKLLESNYVLLRVAERKREVRDALARWQSSKNDPRWHLLNGELASLEDSVPKAVKHYARALELCRPEENIGALKSIMRRGGEKMALAALKRSAPEGEDAEEYSEKILNAYKAMGLSEALRQVGGLWAPNQGRPFTSLAPFIRQKKREPAGSKK
jgi:hypothetical protein